MLRESFSIQRENQRISQLFEKTQQEIDRDLQNENKKRHSNNKNIQHRDDKFICGVRTQTQYEQNSEAAVTSARSRLIPITVYDVLVRDHLARELYSRSIIVSVSLFRDW